MGFGVEVRRPRTVRAFVWVLALMVVLATGARAGRVSAEGRTTSVLIPVVCARPLSAPGGGNPACAVPSPAAIYGVVYDDTNEDGNYTPADAPGGWDVPVEGAVAQLHRADWAAPVIAPLSDGYYCFETLAPGDYVVTIALDPDDARVLEPLDPDAGDVSLRSDEMVTRDFRYARWYAPPPPPPPSFVLHLPVAMAH